MNLIKPKRTMLALKAGERKLFGRKTRFLRERGVLPAVLYGPRIKNNIFLEIDKKDFEQIYKQVGETELIKIKIEERKKDFQVLIHDVQFDPLKEEPIHVDFYQPSLKEKMETEVPLVFVGEAPAVKELGGTLVRNISEIEIKAYPQNLPKEIKVDISPLKAFDDAILVKDLSVPSGVEILRDPEDIIAFVSEPEKVEEELEKPIEEEMVAPELVKEETPKEEEKTEQEQ